VPQTCQRIVRRSVHGFQVTEKADDPEACGKPARFRQQSLSGRIALWLCAECFDEFEAEHGEGSWTPTAEFEGEDTPEEDIDLDIDSDEGDDGDF
jgi:hypothetical protein